MAPHDHVCDWCQVVVASACECRYPKTLRMCEACLAILEVQLKDKKEDQNTSG